MQKILALLFLISTLAVAEECTHNQASQLVSKQTVGEITDLVKTISPGKCIVKYRIYANNDWHTVTWQHTGNEQEEFLCNQAIENGRTQLVTMLGGTFEADAVTVCKEGQARKWRPVKIGDEILENEVARVPEKPKYFKHNDAVCRMFREKYNNGVLRVNNGIICQTDNKLWTVVDKW
jgi:hypothetical protein